MLTDYIIKVCGMREGDNIALIDRLGVDMMGFIFYPKSPRYVEVLPSQMPLSSRRVGVFVDASVAEIVERVQLFELDYVQLHGRESVDFVREVKEATGCRVIKAFSVDSDFDFDETSPYEELCDLFIFDTKCDSVGGSGRCFDWGLIDEYLGTIPFLLSGGISLDCCEQLNRFSHPCLAGYDLNSRFEIAPGVKSVEQVKLFTEKIE